MKIEDRESTEIRVWMLRNGIKRKDIAEEVGVSGMLVTYTIDGVRNNKAVLDCLKKRGCPVKLLGQMPKKRRRAA